MSLKASIIISATVLASASPACAHKIGMICNNPAGRGDAYEFDPVARTFYGGRDRSQFEISSIQKTGTEYMVRGPDPPLSYVSSFGGKKSRIVFSDGTVFPCRIIAMPPAGSPPEAAGAPGVNSKTLTVYGEPVTVAPCSHGIPDSTFAWEDVKAYLPAQILQAPQTPMYHKQILAELKKLSDQASVLEAKEIKQFVPIYEQRHNGDKSDPMMKLVDAFNDDHGAELLPAVSPDKIEVVEKHVKEAIALSCVYYAMMGTTPQ